MIGLVLRAAPLTVVLMVASLVFAEALLVSGFILVTVALVIGPDEAAERAGLIPESRICSKGRPMTDRGTGQIAVD